MSTAHQQADPMWKKMEGLKHVHAWFPPLDQGTNFPYGELGRGPTVLSLLVESLSYGIMEKEVFFPVLMLSMDLSDR